MDSHFWYFRIPTKIPNLEEWDKSQSGILVGNSQLVDTYLTLPNVGFLWVLFKYPKISKNGNLLFFLCTLLELQLPAFFLSCLPYPFIHNVFLGSHPLSSTTTFLKGKFQTSTSSSFFLFYLFLITFTLFSLIFLLNWIQIQAKCWLQNVKPLKQ